MELTLDAIDQRFRKSALFQARNGAGKALDILEQAAKLRVRKEAAFFIRYEPTEYTASVLKKLSDKRCTSHPRQLYRWTDSCVPKPARSVIGTMQNTDGRCDQPLCEIL
jgi:hypothetical protein